jgi:hypothetical protein
MLTTKAIQTLRRVSETEEYRRRVDELETDGLTTSDAQAVADAEILGGKATWIPPDLRRTTGAPKLRKKPRCA